MKQKLNAKQYIRYVDDFVIFHKSEEQLNIWKKQIEDFLKENLKIEIHPDKSKIINLSRGIDFVGFRIFYGHNLLRNRNLRKMKFKIQRFSKGKISHEKMLEIFQGWNAYSKWTNSYALSQKLKTFI